jgi:hypothetical protein
MPDQSILSIVSREKYHFLQADGKLSIESNKNELDS